MALAALLAISAASAQGLANVPDVGLLMPGSAEAAAPLIESFRNGLAEQGLREGSSVRLAVVRAEGPQPFGALAPRLPDQPAVVVGASAAEVGWLTRRYPNAAVVMVAVGDPVGLGLAESLARPGGRVTGLSDFKPAYAEQRLMLAKDFVPHLRRIGFIHNPDAPTVRFTFAAAERLGIQIVPLAARTPRDLEEAIGRIEPAAMDAILVVPYPLTFSHRKAIAARSSEQRLPVFFGYPEFMDLAAPAAGLASFGADLSDLYRRAAGYVVRILAGTKPADLAIGEPEREMLVINLQMARVLGLAVPLDLRRRAGRVIE